MVILREVVKNSADSTDTLIHRAGKLGSEQILSSLNPEQFDHAVQFCFKVECEHMEGKGVRRNAAILSVAYI